MGLAVASRLGLPFDLLIIRKIPVPGNTESGFGAVSLEGDMVLNDPMVRMLRLSPSEIEELAEPVHEELRARNSIFRLVIAGVLCYKLYYYVPAMLGMKTGYPLYVVGSSTFGTTGGYLMPGLLMGLLQIGWFSVGTFVATNFMLAGVGSDAKPGSLTYAIVAIFWGYIMGYVGIKGIQYVSKVALFLNFIPAVMLIIVLFKTMGGVSAYVPDPAKSDAWGGMSVIIAAVVGFFATAGAAGADWA